MTRLMLRRGFILTVLCIFSVCGCATITKKTAKANAKPESVNITVVSKSPKHAAAPLQTSSKSASKQGVFGFGATKTKVQQEKPKPKLKEKEIDDSGGMKVGMQYFAPWRGHNFDTKNIIRMRGTVKSVKTGQTGMMFIVSIILDTKAKGDLLVNLGPLFYLRTKGMFLTKGNRVEVIGSLIRSETGEEKVVAIEIAKGRRILKFRDLAGTPLWASVQPRMWSPESQGLPGWSMSQDGGKKGKSVTKNPDKPVIPNFGKPIQDTGSSAGPPSWNNIQKRQNEIRTRVGSGVPTSIGN